VIVDWGISAIILALRQCGIAQSEWRNAPIGNRPLNRPIGNPQSAMDTFSQEAP
jgi:hypothetical protein